MLLGYQTNSLLQAFPNTTITVIRAFLLIHANLNKVLTRKYMASVLGVSERSVTDLTNELVRLKLITKTRKIGYWNPVNKFEITMLGKLWLPAFKNRYKVLTGVFKRALLSIKLLLSLSLTDFTLLREDYIYNPLVKRELLTRARARKEKATMLIDSKEMSAAQELLSLSKWGVIRLSAYPPAAIAHASTVFRANKNKKDDPIKWYFGICEKWCRDNNTEPALVEAKKYADQHGMPQNPQWTQSRKPIEIPGASPKKPSIAIKEKRQLMTEEELRADRKRLVEKYKGSANIDPNLRILIEGFEKDIQSFYGQQT